MIDGPELTPRGDIAVAPSVVTAAMDPERARIAEGTADQPGPWWSFGPYVSERAWGTVREDYSADYEPAESTAGQFGGNSNWRGPVWFPLNYLVIRALRRLHAGLGDAFTVELPTGSGRLAHLGAVADDLERRLLRLFLPDGAGRRPIWGSCALFQEDPAWRDELLFHEYFHGETGEGLGASHQTGWTALVAALVAERGSRIHRGRESR
jgi:hypothetical protein